MIGVIGVAAFPRRACPHRVGYRSLPVQASSSLIRRQVFDCSLAFSSAARGAVTSLAFVLGEGRVSIGEKESRLETDDAYSLEHQFMVWIVRIDRD